MSLFFGRKSSKTTAAPASAEELVRPRLAKAQSTDTNRFSRSSRSSMDYSNTTGNSRNGNATRDSIVSASPSSGMMLRGSATNGPQSSSRSSALLHKFQGERPASAPVLGSSSKPSSSSSSRGREARRKPIVVHYKQSPALDTHKLQQQLDMDGKALNGSSEMRRTTNGIESSQRTYSVDYDADEAPFDVESAMAGFMASFSPSKKNNSRTSTKKKSIQSSGVSHDDYLKSPVSGSSGDIPMRASATSSATTRSRSHTLQRISVNFTSTQRHAQRAELKAKKYDVEWRNDQDSMCCQVCYAMFTKISRRRHHCRVCGDLVCGDCSIDQVMLQGRFEAPKRACVACVTLLQVMKHNGDPRVSIEGVSSSKSSSAAAAASSDSNQRDQPLATPRYHDRLGEVHRVMAAGKKSERRGSTQTEMYVISSKWLRNWLAFTRSTDGPNNQLDTSSHGGDAFSNNSIAYSPNNNSSNNSGMGAPPPGPIDNMPLLELSKGKLVKRPELIRDDSVGEDEGDYQLISTEVWEVLQRLYGGGPAIRVISDDGFRDWIVDVYALLATAAFHIAIVPTVEHVLVTRHEAAIVTRASYISVEKAALISSGGYESVNILAQSARASFNTGGGGGGGSVTRRQSMSTPSLVDLAEKSTVSRTERASFTSRASMSQARVRPNSPQFGNGNKKSSSQAYYESSRMRATAPQQQLAEDAAAAASGVNIRDSSAATAASAFAVAMKQARLNAQKAIDDRSRARLQLRNSLLFPINNMLFPALRFFQKCIQTLTFETQALCELHQAPYPFTDHVGSPFGLFCMRDLVATTPASHEDVRRDESLRRANLYGVSSAKRLPQVQLLADFKKDARVRKDLLLLTTTRRFGDLEEQHDPHYHFHVLDDELNDRKHREDLGLRPPLDCIQRLQDLFTTAPKDLRTKTQVSNQQHGENGNNNDSIKKREWRVGYKNNPHGDTRGALNGMFEPFDSVRESAVVLKDLPQTLSVAVAYPLLSVSIEKIASDMQPFDEEAARDAMERKTSVRNHESGNANEDQDSEATPWCPASYSTIHTKGKPSLQHHAAAVVVNQTHTLRKVATYDKEKGTARARKTPLCVDEKCVKKKQSLLARAASSYARIRQQIDRNKDPKLRYSLPIEDTSKKRAYRLGLNPVPSSFEGVTTNSSKNNELQSCGDHDSPTTSSPAPHPEKLKFRPRSAAGNVPFRSSALLSESHSSSSYLDPTLSVGKVAGAKRRPNSASVCYLKSSTIYCVDALDHPAAPSASISYPLQQFGLKSEQQQLGSDFGSVLDKERRKRHYNQDQTLVMLSKRGLFHNLPVPQVFARLRRESLKNLTRRLQYAQFEKMSMEDYMSSCGMQTIVSNSILTETQKSSFRIDSSSQVAGAANPENRLAMEVATLTQNDKPEPSKITFTAAPLALSCDGDGGIASTNATTSSSLLAMRKMLFVTRQQFHIALEAFNMSPSDVNLLFSALDVGVEDHVAIWEILCAVEKLQDRHAQLRRSRVQIKARDLPKDLDLLRNSFRIPNVTHSPLEVSQTSEEGHLR